MEYSKTYTAKDEHIDFQNIMDGLYYPFYMEWCRHDFIKEALGFDFEEEAKKWGEYGALKIHAAVCSFPEKRRRVHCYLSADAR
jgi:acyl-CoA thioesterase FadM